MHQTIISHLMPAANQSTKLARVSDWIGLIGLVIFSSFSLFSIAGANVGLALMLLALLLSSDAWRQLLRQPLFWLCLITIGYISLRSVWSNLYFPVAPKTQIDQTKDWALLFLFFIPAWWMSRTPNRPILGLSLMICGFSLGIITSSDSEILTRFQEGIRSGLHFGKPVIFGFDCAVTIIALAILLVYWIDTKHGYTRPKRAIYISLTLLAILFFTQGLIVSQSRGVWLAIIITLPATFLMLWLGRRHHTTNKKHPRLIFIGILVILSLALWMNWNTITQRVFVERQELRAAFSEGLENAPLSSSTYRLHLWQFGLHKWLERPLTGWGPGTTHAMIQIEDTIELKNPNGTSFDHLHNAYLELLFQLGLVGFVLVCTICGVMVRNSYKAYQEKRISIYLLAFLFSNYILIAVYSLTDFRHLHWNWSFYWLIIAALAFTNDITAHKDPVGRE